MFLEENVKFLSPTAGNYLYGRLRSIWRCALQHREEKPLVSQQRWSGSTLVFSWRFIYEKHINVQLLRRTVFDHLMEHERTFINHFPKSFAPELDTIQVQSFVDDEDAVSLFSLPENQLLLTPLVNKLIGCFQADKVSSSQIFNSSQQFLLSFLIAIYLTTCVPPKVFQVADFCYASDKNRTGGRNFRLVDNKHGVFANAKATRSKTNLNAPPVDAFWLLPPQLTRTLLIFLGVYHPAEAFFATQIYPPDRLAPLQTHIFCNPGRRSRFSIIWSDDNIDECLKHSSPLHVEAYAHCLIMTQIMHRFFKPMLERSESATVLDKQSQHASRTAKRRYAVERLQNITGSQYIRKM
jgi:hypothetical protein